MKGLQLCKHQDTLAPLEGLLERRYEEGLDEIEGRRIDEFVRGSNHADHLARKVRQIFGSRIINHLEKGVACVSMGSVSSHPNHPPSVQESCRSSDGEFREIFSEYLV